MHIVKKYYFINNFDTNNIDNQNKDTIIIYRDYTAKKNNETQILKISEYCRKRAIKFYLSNNIRLAIKLKLDGAYIPSFNKSMKHLSYTLKKDFKIIGSAHNLQEIKLKEKQKVKKIFLSSLFKKNKNYLGINKFKLLSNLSNIKIVALGGISEKNIKKLYLLKSNEFAGISYFE
jgi:thiamine-phosphate pyrophosphorylase